MFLQLSWPNAGFVLPIGRVKQFCMPGNVLATTPVDYSCHATSLQMWRPQNPFPYSERKLDVSISHGNKLEMTDVTLDC